MIEIIYRNGYEFQIDRERPNVRFKGGGVKTPPVPDPAPIPQEDDTVEDETIRRAVRKSGRRNSIITGNLRPTPTRKTILG